jgi:putative hydrolase of the HAD superfamily
MLKAIIFDLYRTLIDIRTDEQDPSVYATLARFLSYRSVCVEPERLKGMLFSGIERTMHESAETFPEIDVFEIFKSIMVSNGQGPYRRDAVIDACTAYRSLTVRRFCLFPGVSHVLHSLRDQYRLGLVSDAQWAYARPEMRMTGLEGLFDVVILSSTLGFKKPDPRIFQRALMKLRVSSDAAVYIGDNPERDIVGARGVGMGCVLFRSEDGPVPIGVEPDAIFSDYRELPALLKKM